MKSILKIMTLTGLAFTLASCGSVNDPYGSNDPYGYPTNYPNDGSVYRAPDGTVYRRGDVYRDRNGNVYENGRVVRTGDVYGQPGILGGRTGQVYYPDANRRNLPPGQAKKIYGGQATDYAKGQVKKRNRAWQNTNDNRNLRNEDYRKTNGFKKADNNNRSNDYKRTEDYRKSKKNAKSNDQD